jgi:hypothetical protein
MDYRNIPTNEPLPATLPDTISALKREHASRAVRGHTLSMMLAVGLLFLLQDILSSIPIERRYVYKEHGWLIQYAFVCTSVSILAGAIHVFLDMIFPLRVANLLSSAIQQGIDLSTPSAQNYLDKRGNTYLLRGIPVVAHLLFLLLGFVYGMSYRLTMWNW